MTTIYLIRHAEALDREDWDKEDAKRPLTKRGKEQAEKLAKHLSKSAINEIRTSPAVRCKDTVKPLAKALKLKLVEDARLFEGNGALELPNDGKVYALCSHGDIIPETLDELGVEAEKCSKGSVWKLTLDKKGGVERSEYIPPQA